MDKTKELTQYRRDLKQMNEEMNGFNSLKLRLYSQIDVLTKQIYNKKQQIKTLKNGKKL